MNTKSEKAADKSASISVQTTEHHHHEHDHNGCCAVHTKIGRNDPCACGSGKKYKKCCLHSHIAG